MVTDEDASPKSSLDDSHISRKKRMHNITSARNRFIGLSTEQKKRKFSEDIKSSDSEISNEKQMSQASIKNYKLLKTIGKGLYSKVKLAASKNHSN